MRRYALMLAALGALATVANANIVEFKVANDTDGAITCTAVYSGDTQAIDGIHNVFAPGHILSDPDAFTTDTELDPTVTVANAMQNDTGLPWTAYDIKFGIRAKVAGTLSNLSLSATAVGPSDWTADIVQNLTLTGSYTDYDGRVLENYYIAEINYSGPAVADGESVDLRYTFSFKGATSYLFWQEATPIPEPMTLSLVAAGGLAMLRLRRRAH